MLRRAYAFAGQTSLLEHRGVILNLSDTSLEVNGEKVELTKNEFRILQILFEHRDEIVSRAAYIFIWNRRKQGAIW